MHHLSLKLMVSFTWDRGAASKELWLAGETVMWTATVPSQFYYTAVVSAYKFFSSCPFWPTLALIIILKPGSSIYHAFILEINLGSDTQIGQNNLLWMEAAEQQWNCQGCGFFQYPLEGLVEPCSMKGTFKPCVSLKGDTLLTSDRPDHHTDGI